MKKQFSRFLSLLLTASLVVMLFPVFTTTASAASLSNVQKRLSFLKEKYKDGKYWNHIVSTPTESGNYLLDYSHDERFAESVSETPCTYHTDSYRGDYVGTWDCSYFDGGLQCVGFASRIFYELFDGHRRSNMAIRKDMENIQPGDYVRFAPNDYSREGHSVVVLEKNGSTIKVVECNYGGNPCRIRWGAEYDLNAGVSAPGGGRYPFAYFCHADNYDEVNQLGADFYATIYYPHGGCNLVNKNGNVELARPANGFDSSEIWHVTWTPAGYKIVNMLDERCLDAENRDTRPGTNVQVFWSNDTPAQRWILRRDSGGRENCYNLAASYIPSLVLDVYWEATTPGTNVQLYSAKSNAAQAFEFRAVPSIEMALSIARMRH